jgi:hypothetical protein
MRMLAVIVAAACCLAVAIVAGTAAHAELTSKPTSADLSAAAAQAMADRWRSWPAGRIFPSRLGYSTSLLTQETARRLGISPSATCAAAIDVALDRLARRESCRAAVRATYVDELQGTVYTVGVLAFGSARGAAAFAHGLPAGQAGVTTLGAEAFPGTASATFDDAARQAFTAAQQGPFVVLTVAGYADGRPAAATAESRGSVFAPAAQLASEIIEPLTAPVQVNCASREWSC